MAATVKLKYEEADLRENIPKDDSSNLPPISTSSHWLELCHMLIPKPLICNGKDLPSALGLEERLSSSEATDKLLLERKKVWIRQEGVGGSY